MASANFSGDGRYRIDYTVSVVQQDVANNRTLIRRVLNMVKQSGSGDWSSSPVSYFSSTGPTTIGTSYFSFDFTSYSTLTLINTTQWVNHNADGTMGFTATAFVAADLSTGSPSSRQASVSFWVSLPTIPRATTPTMSGGFTTGVTSTIDLPRASTAFTHDVSWSIGTKNGSLGTGLATAATWNPPHTVLTELPNAASANVTITVVTKNGATVIGTRTAQFTLTAAASIVPTVSGVTWTDTNTTVATNIGGYVQGHSLLRGAVSASGVHGSTITSKSVIVGGQTLPENTVFTVSGSGTVTAQGQAIDSRGRTNTTPANFTVLPYSEPTIGANGWQVSRANASNVATNDGAYLRLDLHAIATGLTVGGVQKNSLTISVRTRPTNGSWTNRNTVTPGLTQNGAIQITGGAAFLTTQSYEVEVTITDKVITTPMVLKTTISTAIVTIDLNGNSVGIGKYHENGVLDVAGDIHATGVKAQGLIEANMVYANASIVTSGIVSGVVGVHDMYGDVRQIPATQGEVNAGTDTTRYVSPNTLKNNRVMQSEWERVVPTNITGLLAGSTATIDPETGIINVVGLTQQIVIWGLLEDDYEYKVINDLRVDGKNATANSLWFRLVVDGHVTSIAAYQTAGWWSAFNGVWGVYSASANIGGAIGMVSGGAGAQNPYHGEFTLTPNKGLSNYWFNFSSMTQGSARATGGSGYTPAPPSGKWNGLNYYVGGTGDFQGEIQIFRRRLR